MHTIRAEVGLKALAFRQVGRRTILQAGAQGILNCGFGADASHISAKRANKSRSATERNSDKLAQGTHAHGFADASTDDIGQTSLAARAEVASGLGG